MTIEERKIFLGELKKVPSRKVLKVISSREQILELVRKINFKAIEEIYWKEEEKGLGLVKKDIPMELLFQANFFFMVSIEFEEELGTKGDWMVFEAWNLKDKATFLMLEKYATFIGDRETSIYDAYSFKLDAVVRYANSKKPDLR